MQEFVLSSVMEQGVWAVLFVSLYMYQLKEARRLQEEASNRENKLTEFITIITQQHETLAHQFQTLSNRYEKINDDITGIKVELQVMNRNNNKPPT